MTTSEQLYKRMYFIRRFEETLLDLFSAGKLVGTTHTYIGQEANAAGIIAHLDRQRDVVFSNHRCHGHYLAFTDDAYGLLCEVMGKADGVCGGKGGSQHLCNGNFYSNGVLGSIVPVATGIALAERERGAGAGTLAFLVGFAPQLLAYDAINGYPGPSKLVARKMSWHSPHALQVLLSPEHGFLFWTPIALFAIAGLLLVAFRPHQDPSRVGRCALLMFALQVYVSGSVESWRVAGAFGQRRFVAITVLLVIGLSALLRALPRGKPRLAAGAVLGICVWWNLALTAAFGMGLMNRQRLELKRNAYDAFVTIPKMAPELALRYLTDRDSFYQSGQRE